YRYVGLLPESDDAWSWTKNFIKSADTGISNIKVEIEEVERANNRTLPFETVWFQHSLSDENSWLDFSEESKGTQMLFQMAAPIYNALKLGSLLLIDELDSSLHVSIGNTIIQLFNNPKTNPHNAQLIFTTHDTNLLGTIPDEPALRRDQIWFTEKDKEGGTNLYPLTDYKPRKSENLERGYLQGRYGAIPFLGDFNQLTEEIHGET
ncbi:abortive infection protein, putative, partial [hydrothermal vent metagenome]